MEEKIKKSLENIAKVHRLYIDDETQTGILYLNEPCITATVLQLLSRIFDIVAITAIMSNEYTITFRFH